MRTLCLPLFLSFLFPLTVSAPAAIIDVRTTAANTPVAGPNGAVLTVTDAQSAGTGLITSFLRLHGTGGAPDQKGYNVGFPQNNFPSGFPDFQQVAGNFTFKIQLGNIPHVGAASPGGFRRFLLDINEPGGNQEDLTLERLFLFVGAVNPQTLIGAGGDPSQLGDPSAAFGDRVYDMGADMILMRDRFPGSGAFDLAIDIPESYFAGHNSSEFVTLFADFGNFEGGFEEFAVRGSGGGPGPGGEDDLEIPEPTTALLLGLGITGFALYRWRTRRHRASSDNPAT